MFRIQILERSDSARGVFFRCSIRIGWLQRLILNRHPETAHRVFGGRRKDGWFFPDGSALQAEVDRILPWRDNPVVRRMPGVCVYDIRHGRGLHIDVWDERLEQDAETVADTTLAYLTHRNPGSTFRRTQTRIPLAIRRDMGCGYHSTGLVRIKTSRLPPDAEHFEDELTHILYEGLVSATLWQPDPLHLLEVIPDLRQSRLCLDATPDLVAPAGERNNCLYHGIRFSMELDVTGCWSIGGGTLFGFGEVRNNRRAAPVTSARPGRQLPRQTLAA